jgi:hypothetical protein
MHVSFVKKPCSRPWLAFRVGLDQEQLHEVVGDTEKGDADP